VSWTGVAGAALDAGTADFAARGLLRLRGAARSIVAALDEHFAPNAPSSRLDRDAALAALLVDGPADAIASQLLDRPAFPVRALFLNKNAGANWALGWHQDRVIAVKERRDVPGFGNWTVKDGIHHCAPPAAVLERMVTLRIHIDPAGPDNAPLLVAPGSQRMGLVPERAIPDAVERCGTEACLAEPGDIWATATLILHASASANVLNSRRVLQIDYAADALPGGLEWRDFGHPDRR
jgi:hypothetical protein